MAGQGKVLLYSRWKKLLDIAWRLPPGELGQLEALFLELLGYQIRHRVGQRHEPLVAATGADAGLYCHASVGRTAVKNRLSLGPFRGEPR